MAGPGDACWKGFSAFTASTSSGWWNAVAVHAMDQTQSSPICQAGCSACPGPQLWTKANQVVPARSSLANEACAWTMITQIDAAEIFEGRCGRRPGKPAAASAASSLSPPGAADGEQLLDGLHNKADLTTQDSSQLQTPRSEYFPPQRSPKLDISQFESEKPLST